jgi:hypothetical protein
MVREAVKTPLRDADIFSHSAVHTVAKAAAGGIEIIKAGASERREFVDDGGGFADHAVAFFEVRDFTSVCGDSTAELMTEDAGIIHRPTMGAAPLMEIAAADADGAYLEENVSRTDLRDGGLSQFNGERCACVVHKRRHL